MGIQTLYQYKMQLFSNGNALRRLVLLAVAGRASHTTETIWQYIDDNFFFPIKRNTLVSETGPVFKGARRWLLLLTSETQTHQDFYSRRGHHPLDHEALGKQPVVSVQGGGQASTQRTPRWLCIGFPSADSVKGWAFF